MNTLECFGEKNGQKMCFYKNVDNKNLGIFVLSTISTDIEMVTVELS